MKQLGLFITKRCNLKCRLCSGHIPYTKEPADTPFSTLKEMIDNYFEAVDFVEKVVVSGGETFLYRELPKLLRYLSLYKERFQILELFTNGTILPEEDCLLELEGLQKSHEGGYHLRVFIDDYGPELSTHVKELSSLLEKRNIVHTVRAYNEQEAHCGGWVDFGDLKTVLWTTEEEKEKIKKGCAFLNELKGCQGTSDGIVYPCTPTRIQNEFHLAASDGCGVNLLDTAITKEKRRELLEAMVQKDWYSTCAYCKGMRKDSERFLPAEQLTKEEIEFIKCGARSWQEIQEMKKGPKEEINETIRAVYNKEM